jgi:hypothetical protein
MNSSNSIKLLALSITAVLLGASNYGRAQALEFTDSTLTEKIAFESAKASELATKEGLKIVYYGSDQFKKLMQERGAVTGADQDDLATKAGVALDESASNQLVIVEKTQSDQALFERLLARGNVIISVGASLDAAGRAWNYVSIRNAGLRQEEGALAKFGVSTQKVTAYRFSPYGSSTFATDEPNETLAIAEAIRWATDAIMLEKPLVSQYLSKATTTYTISGTQSCKSSKGSITGKVNTSYIFVKKDDNSSTKDYWTITLNIEAKPGNDSRISKYENWISSTNMVDWDPQSTVKDSTASVSLSGGGVTGAWSYAKAGITITGKSDMSADKGKWTHTFERAAAAARDTFKIQPGVLIETPQGMIPYFNANATVTFLSRSFVSGKAVCGVNSEAE